MNETEADDVDNGWDQLMEALKDHREEDQVEWMRHMIPELKTFDVATVPHTGIVVVVSKFTKYRSRITRHIVSQLCDRYCAVFSCDVATKHLLPVKSDAPMIVVCDGPKVVDRDFEDWLSDIARKSLVILSARCRDGIPWRLPRPPSFLFLGDGVFPNHPRLVSWFPALFTSRVPFDRLLGCYTRGCDALVVGTGTGLEGLSHLLVPPVASAVPRWDPEKAFVFLAAWSPKWQPYIHQLVEEFVRWSSSQRNYRIKALLEVDSRFLVQKRYGRIAWEDPFYDGPFQPITGDGYLEMGGIVSKQLDDEADANRMLDNEAKTWLSFVNPHEVQFDGKALQIAIPGQCKDGWPCEQTVILTQAGIQALSLRVWPLASMGYEDVVTDVHIGWFRQRVRIWARRTRLRKIAHSGLAVLVPPELANCVTEFI